MSSILRWLGRGRAYSVRQFDTKQKGIVEKETEILDERFVFDIKTVEYVTKLRLQNVVTPVLNIPLAYNASRKCFEVLEAPSVIEARVKGYYYGAVVPEYTVPDYYALRLDRYAKLMVNLYGKDVALYWVHGSEVTAPSADTALVTKTVTSGKKGYIYGFFISAGEANDFKINFVSGGTAYSIRIPFGSKGAIHFADIIPLNEGMAADGGTDITITNVNAGSTEAVYQARLLIAEE